MEKPLFYMILLGLLCLVMARMLPKRKAHTEVAPVKELEETLEHFASELEEENKELLQAVSRLKQENEQQVSRLISRVELLEKQNYDLAQEMKQLAFSSLCQQEAEKKAYRESAGEPMTTGAVGQRMEPETLPVVTEPVVEAAAPVEAESATHVKARYAGLFKLYAQGKSVEQIAKKLGMNKGEVMLIIQLAQQEEQSRA